MTFKDHFSTVASGYRDYRPRYPDALVDVLTDLAPACGCAWDVGCGSGQLSVSLVCRFQNVIATDASAAQIAEAEPAPNIAYRVAPAENSGIADHFCDLIVAAQAAHWFDLPRFYDEARRVGKPRAGIALVGYSLQSITAELDAVMEPFYWGFLQEYWPPERAHLDRSYRDLPFPFAEVQPPSLHLTAEWSLENYLGYLRTWSAVKEARKALGRDVIDDIEPELRQAWGDAAIRTVRWPLHLRLGHL